MGSGSAANERGDSRSFCLRSDATPRRIPRRLRSWPSGSEARSTPRASGEATRSHLSGRKAPSRAARGSPPQRRSPRQSRPNPTARKRRSTKADGEEHRDRSGDPAHARAPTSEKTRSRRATAHAPCTPRKRMPRGSITRSVRHRPSSASARDGWARPRSDERLAAIATRQEQAPGRQVSALSSWTSTSSLARSGRTAPIPLQAIASAVVRAAADRAAGGLGGS